MSPSGFVIIRCVNPLPASVVMVWTRFAAISRSRGAVVVTLPLLVVALLPDPWTVTSSALTGSILAYSRMRMSGYVAAAVKVIVKAFAFAAAALMFLAK
jgi:hypothetical protein